MNLKILQALLFLRGKEGMLITDIKKDLSIGEKEVKKLLNQLEEKLLKNDSPFIIKKFERSI